jgi:hypothetical protein
VIQFVFHNAQQQILGVAYLSPAGSEHDCIWFNDTATEYFGVSMYVGEETVADLSW